MQLINHRFRIIEGLSSDAFGEIFLVEDIQKNIICRLRLFSLEFSNSYIINNYKENFISYSTLIHPNIYSDYKFDIIDTIDGKAHSKNQFFYTYENIKEESIDYLNLTRQESITVLIEICAALKYIHFRGYVYRYLTFENIQIYRNEKLELKVKLRDLASLQIYRESTKTEKFTSQFIAPEIFWKENHSIQADIYSLGTIFYYLYHRVSFKNRSVDENLRKNIKNIVDKVVAQMIRVSVVEEIISIDNFVEIIGDLFNIDITFDDYKYYNKLQTKISILERFNERSYIPKIVKEKFERSTDNNALIVVGDMGTGKSRVLSEAQTILRWEGYRVIRVNCDKQDKGSYDIFKSIVEQIISYGDLSQDLIIKYGSELVKLVPNVSEHWLVQPSEPLEKNIEQLRIKNRLHNFLREYSSSQKLIVILDGIQLLNVDQAELLEYLFTDVKENQYFIIASYENDNINSNRILEWEKNKKIIIKNIVSCNYDQASSFVSSILGVGYNPIELTAKVMRDALGNFKLIKDIIKGLFEKGYIYVKANGEWILKDKFDSYEYSNLSIMQTEVQSEIDKLSIDALLILDLVSLFKESAPLDCINNLVELNLDILSKNLRELTHYNILKMKFDDLGETYDFCSKSLKRSINEKLDKNIKKSYHLSIANHFEKRISSDGYQYMELIIHHFANGKEKNKGIKYCIELAEEMEKNSMFMQAIELYNRGVGILHAQTKSPLVATIFYKIGKIYYLIGESESAKTVTYKGLDLATKNNHYGVMIKCKTLLASLYLDRRDITRCKQYLSDLEVLVSYIENDDLDNRVKLVKTSLYISEGDYLEASNLIKSVLDEKLENKEIEAEFLSNKGLLELKNGDLGIALKSFELSIEIYKSLDIKNPIKALEPENYIGMLYCSYLNEVEKGRYHFLNVIKRAESMNLVNSTALFIKNLGETYLIEDRLEEALESFQRSQKIVSKTMNSFIRADLCGLLCKLFLKSENYQKASFYLRKLESEYEDYNNNSFANTDFYIIHIKYYLQIKDFDIASQWCKRLRSTDLILESKEEFILRVYEFEIEVFRKQYFNYTANIDLRFVEILVKTQSNIIEAKVVRLLILHLSTNLMNYKKYIDVHYLLKLDNSLSESFSTDSIELKHNILSGVLKDNRLEYFETLLEKENAMLGMEDKWLIFKMLGDEHYDNYNYYDAISCYFNAFDLLRGLADLLPKKNKENYIFCDEVKLDLKSKINNIHRKLIGQSYREKTVYTELEIRKADDFFDLSDFKNFVYNKSIKQSISNLYKEKHGIVLDTVSNLISNFGKNEIRNIRLILKYCTQMLMGDRGFIFIIDDDNNTRKIIKSNEYSEQPNLDRILKSSVNINEGLLINTVYDNLNAYPFIEDEKGFLCIPITKNEKDNNNRREKDYEEYNNTEVNGYMYIDSKNAFNNFTSEAFDECMSVMNMLYFFVDNYNLKKISTIDKLTDVYLRSYFEDLFSRELQRAKTNGTDLSVVMLDIDKFKVINDTYGHRKGDEILTNMCKVIKDTIRDTDLIGRYGGEEFILVFPNTNKENAYMICEKIRTTIMNTNFLKDDRRVTISIGISSYPEFTLLEDELIEKADQALYKSKNSGRNKTTIWNIDFGESNKRFDKLAGILEGNISTDTRNVQAIVDIMNTVKSKKEPEKKTKQILTTIGDVCEAHEISLIKLEKGKIVQVSTKHTGRALIDEELIVDKELITKFSKLDNAHHFINWNDISEVDEKQIPNWKSLIISPLIFKDECRGLLVISVPIQVKEFDFNTTNFINAISGVIGTMI